MHAAKIRTVEIKDKAKQINRSINNLFVVFQNRQCGTFPWVFDEKNSKKF